MQRRTLFIARAAAAFGLLLLSAPLAAQVLTVGTLPGCQFPNLQDAIDATHDAVNVIHVAGNLTNQHSIIDNKVVEIVGGFSSCSADTSTGVSTISELPHSGDSVIEIKRHSIVTLRNLGLADGHTSDTGRGGGINFSGSGALTLRHVAIFDNRAGYGAGINVSADDPTEVDIGENTSVYANIAARAGGGIRVEGAVKLTMTSGDESAIYGNQALNVADGAGGGLQVLGSEASAELGSVSISDNHAIVGGGISVHHGAFVRIFQTRLSKPSSIDHNTATRIGGGIYLDADNDSYSQLLGWGFKADNNIAANGAALYVDVDGVLGGQVAMKPSVVNGIAGALNCDDGTSCVSMNGNTATQSDGAVMLIQSHSYYTLQSIELRHNEAGRALQMFGSNPDYHDVSDCLIADNTLRNEVIRVDENAALTLRNCTITNNAVGASNVLSMSGDIDLSASIVMQPGKTILNHRSDGSVIANVIASEIVSLGSGTGILFADPKFLDAPSGNYHLARNSPALDFAPAVNGRDLEGHTRVVDLADIANRPGGGPMDLGAYELQSLPPFPPNENFDQVAAPILAAGWIENHTGLTQGWYTANFSSFSGPNAAFVDAPAEISDATLTSPPVAIDHSAVLTFKHRLGLEPSFDGAVLEISIGVGPFEDIIAAGGHFVQGGYTRTIPTDFGNPLAGRNAWEGSTGDLYPTVIVLLPHAADHQSVRFRWRIGTDQSNGGSGYWLDNVHVDVSEVIVDRIFCDGFEGSCR